MRHPEWKDFAACDESERVTRAVLPNAQVWKGPELHPSARGIKVLGTPFGHPEYVHARLEALTEKHQFLLERIPITNVESVWVLLWHCVDAKSNHFFRVVRSEATVAFARAHDEGLWTCLSAKFGGVLATAREVASLPFAMGGMGFWRCGPAETM